MVVVQTKKIVFLFTLNAKCGIFRGRHSQVTYCLVPEYLGDVQGQDIDDPV